MNYDQGRMRTKVNAEYTFGTARLKSCGRLPPKIPALLDIIETRVAELQGTGKRETR
jgi:hypothetical protein